MARLLALGEDMGIRPHGLQALFALRLEKGHVIIGMDTELDTTARRLGMDWAVNMEKGDFNGRDALARLTDVPDHRRLLGFTMAGPAPTEGSPIWSEGDVVGHVTSTFALAHARPGGDARLVEAQSVPRGGGDRRPCGGRHPHALL